MYARELRKWSLKYQMSHLWLLSAVVTMLLFLIYCPNAASMHLPINTNTRDPALRIPSSTDSRTYNWWLDRLSTTTTSSSSRQTKHNNSNLSSSISNTNNNFNSYNPLAVFSDLRNHHARARAPVNAATLTTYTAAVTAADSINSNKSSNNNNHQVPIVPNSNSQINLNLNSYANSLTSSAYDYSNSRSNKLRRHTNQPNANNYHSPVRVPVPPLPTSLLHPMRYAIATFHVPAEDRPSASSELDEQQRRRRTLLRQQAHNRTMLLATARSRRDSATSTAPLVGYSRSSASTSTSTLSSASSLSSSSTSLGSVGSYNNYNYNYNFNNKHHNNRNYHQHHHQHHNNNRKRTRRYCSARDPAQLAFEAPTVFEGKIISMTRDRRANFSATVEVKEVFKQQIGFRLQNFLRLQFAYRNTSAECDIYREFLRPRGLVRGDELEQGRIYVMFVQQIDPSNFTILGQPIRKTRRVIEAVKNAVSENYAQLASIKSIAASNRTVENGKELRIVCKVQGQPPPKVTWFKDHKSINRNRKLYQFIHYKRRSELIIRSFNSSDAGRYECRAKNKVNRNLERRAIVIKAYPMPRYDAPTQQSGEKCPDSYESLCFNGGTCKFFPEISYYSCICPDGFLGERCDRKEVSNLPPTPTFITGYIADDPNVFDKDATNTDSDETNDDDDEDESLYPPTKDPFYNKFT